VEQQGGPAEGQFQGGSVLRVADQPVGEPEAARVRGAGPQDAQMAATGPPKVDDRGERAGLDDLDDRVPRIGRPG